MSLSFSTNPASIRSLKHFSDEAVARSIYARHRDGKKIKFDIDNYIALVDSIITTADRITKGNKEGFKFSDDFLNVDPPIFTLNQISTELTRKAPGIEKAHQTTLNILEILVSYPWEAKAVLTLTAFATEYGDIWHLNHYSLLDPLANSLSMIKGVPFLKKQLNSIKYRQVLLCPNSLIYSCLRAIKYMSQLKKHFKHDVNQLSELSSAFSRQIPLVSYWVIHIIVAAQFEISSYLNDTEGQPQNYLDELSEKIDSILNTLGSYLNIV